MYNFRNKPASKVKAGALIGELYNIPDPMLTDVHEFTCECVVGEDIMS